MFRTPLGEITPDKVIRKELSVIQRSRIYGAYNAGKDIVEIAELYEIPESVIRDTLKLGPIRNN